MDNAGLMPGCTGRAAGAGRENSPGQGWEGTARGKGQGCRKGGLLDSSLI